MRFAIVGCLLAGCGVTDFDISQPVPEQRIAGSPLPGPLAGLFPIPISLDIAAKIKAMDTGPIDRVSLASLELAITTTDEPASDHDDWSFISEITVYVSSTASGSTLPKVQVAHVSNPGATQTIAFDVDGSVNLKPYIDEGSRVDGESSGTAPPDDVSYDGTGVFTVHPL